MLLIDKPLHCSSHDVVQTLRRITRQRRIGHAGTLDPLAEGLLVVCLGHATKIARFLTGFDKVYVATICLGRTSATFDGEGIDAEAPAAPVPDFPRADLESALRRFEGRVTQRVPAFSAVRVEGVPLYKKARRGEEVDPPSREVTIREIRLLEVALPYLRIEVTCSSGTYIRTLADDLGRVLGCGAYLAHLRRTRVGDLALSGALTLDQAADAMADGYLHQHLLGYGEVLPYSALRVSEQFRPHVIEGRRPDRDDLTGLDGSFRAGDTVLLKSDDGAVLAVGRAGVDSADLARPAARSLFDYIRVLH
ncbi:MAG TPA: tRNA pseudouridine(55) synthase TruB [candidate division Zixibacteria bacterium]|nr:tRNA pseudouridine(55) synthase TruB [candidate division Zixibacteria bacterium]MDD4918674.1 tRNA pseudouridine(55) synthase TruB [candidate division Zixibacteria bacterium]MDM7973099.1 tRNA pseudouridine(55) synthase TruB [candidate division Zixibacteria bacterium]HOD67706.1 tRNA pseudouridine(55) synthase TruB [candidate division Zixibacteria bacterium]HOZ08439.1 tRNA pseudouridine(55) synthase TruB [candidate division Zixibacteria bacterium]